MNYKTNLQQLKQTSHIEYQRYVLAISTIVVYHLVTVLCMGIIHQYMLMKLMIASLVLIGSIILASLSFGKWRILLLCMFSDMILTICVLTYYLGWAYGYGLYGLLLIPTSFIFTTYDKDIKETGRKGGILCVIDLLAMTAVVHICRNAMPCEEALQIKQICITNYAVVGIVLVFLITQFIKEISASHIELSYQARFDSLTGLRNRMGILQDLKDDTLNYMAAMGDIDEFKAINDTYGHDVGDIVLRRIGEAISKSLSNQDLACRWGGEEFLLFIKDDGNAESVLERIQHNISKLEFEAGGQKFRVTMTFGVARGTEADNFDKLISLVDNRMYLGKRNGKNCVISTEHVIGNVLKEDALKQIREAKIDKTGLSDRTFAAFAATLDRNYMYMCNMDTNISRWSSNAVDYFGLDGEYFEDAASMWLEHVHPDDRQKYIDDINAVFSGQKEYHDVSYRALNKYGEYVLCVCRGVILKGDMTHPAMFAGTMTNQGVVGRKDSEENPLKYFKQ